jgi:hypothetical protein
MSGGMRDVYRKVPPYARAYFSPSGGGPKEKAASWPPKRSVAVRKLWPNVLFVVFQDDGTEAEAESDADDDAEQ